MTLEGPKIHICDSRMRIFNTSINIMFSIPLFTITNFTFQGYAYAEFPIPSCREVFWKSFRDFPRLVGRYCSQLLPKQGRGTPKTEHDKISLHDGMRNSVDKIANSAKKQGCEGTYQFKELSSFSSAYFWN